MKFVDKYKEMIKTLKKSKKSSRIILYHCFLVIFIKLLFDNGIDNILRLKRIWLEKLQ